MRIIKPEKLKKGDLIGIISPASPIDDLSKIEQSVIYFEKQGFRVTLGLNIEKGKGYLAGTDKERVDDLHKMFLNKRVKMVMCLRGGYGAGRLLDKINYSIIKDNPKIFCGYSDITIMQNAFLKKAGLVTFASPMAGVEFYKEVNKFTEEHFWNAVLNGKPIVHNNNEGSRITCLRKGISEGRLVGGNLSLITSMIGTEYIPDPEGKILMLEEVGEVPYRIDRMLNQIRLSGYLDKINGVLLGGFTDCEEKDPTSESLSIQEVLKDYFSKGGNLPVLSGFSHGHLTENLTVPLGIKVRIDAVKCRIEFMESHLTS